MAINRLLASSRFSPGETEILNRALAYTLRKIGLVDRNDPITEMIARKVIEIGGEDEYTFEELRELYCKALGKNVRFIYLPLPLARFIAATVDYLTGDRFNAKGLVSAFSGGSTCSRSGSGNSNGGGGRNAEFLFHRFHKISQFKDGQFLDLVKDSLSGFG
mgnify:CR=1 FL=1